MLTQLDHIVLICPDLSEGIADYSALLGRGPDWQTEDANSGVATALFRVSNTALELLAPFGETPEKLRAMTQDGARLTSLAFSARDIERAHHTLSRRGLEPSEVTQGQSTDIISKSSQTWQRFRCADTACAGIKTFILQRPETRTASDFAPGDVSRLDHVVINTSNPERAIAHYGARLGLRFALDRTIEKFKTRFLFFRIGGLTLEIVQKLDQPGQDEDNFWGLTWAVENLESAHARLSELGADISEIRTGRKPGSRVFTVRSHTLGIPTLFIAHDPKA